MSKDVWQADNQQDRNALTEPLQKTSQEVEGRLL